MLTEDRKADTGLLPTDPEDQDRWRETAPRRRMMDGTSRVDLEREFKDRLHATSLEGLGRISRGIMLFPSVIRQTTRLYDNEPTVTIADIDGDDLERVQTMHAESYVWQMAQTHAGYVAACRESTYRIGWTDRGKVSLRHVVPDSLVAWAPLDDPGNVVQIREARLRPVRDKDGKLVLKPCWDVWTADPDGLLPSSLRVADDMDGGSFAIMLPGASGAVNVTAEVLGPDEAERGETYEYRIPDGPDAGKPFLPWVLYHARQCGKLWNPYEMAELVDGSMDVAVLWNKFHFLTTQCAFTQRVLLNGEVPGTVAEGSNKGIARRIHQDFDSVLQVNNRNPEVAAALGSWPIPVEPMSYADAILAYQKTVVSVAGVHPEDIERASGAESGYAIQLKRSAQRREAKRYEPGFRAGDVELMGKMAMVHNIFSNDTAMPTEGYGITYNYVEDDTDSQLKEIELDNALEEAGLTDRAARLMKRKPSLSVDQAWEEVTDIAVRQAATKAVARLAAEEVTTAVEAEDIGREELIAQAEALMARANALPPTPPKAEEDEDTDEEDEDG